MQGGFIFAPAPFPSSHASTIAETGRGLIAAWFAGTREGHEDVSIWVADHDGARWSAPRRVATGRMSPLRRYPCWNPVLHRAAGGRLLLFYKLGPSPSRWWGMLMHSDDDGRSWSPPERLPAGILGPVKNKPLARPGGVLLCPSSREDDGWRVHLECTTDLGRGWRRSPPLNDRHAFKAIQPTLLAWPGGGRLQLLCRTRSGVVGECWSDDDGGTWSTMRPTVLPNPDSGIDAVMLRDGTALLVYNHSATGRSPLNLALSEDGVTWRPAGVLEDGPGEFSYPAVIEGADGRVHITYTWNRLRIRHVVLEARPSAGVWSRAL